MTKKMVKKVLMVLVAVLFVAVAVYTVVTNNHYSDTEIPLSKFISICEMACMAVLSCYYVLVGCNKEDGSIFYKVFMNMFALFELVSLINHAEESTISVILTASKACMLILLQAKDTGEIRSKGLGGSLIAFSVIEFISLSTFGFEGLAVFTFMIEVIIEVITLFMIIVKYIDKKERGSK